MRANKTKEERREEGSEEGNTAPASKGKQRRRDREVGGRKKGH